MSDKDLCTMGKKTKIFSYLEEETQQFIVLTCKLKNEITELDLKKFFNQVYNARLDKGYETIFQTSFTTLNLIECFKDILKESQVVNLESLYHILNKEDNTNWEPLKKVMKEFHKMFEISGISYSFKEFQVMERMIARNQWFNPDNSKFNKELAALPYNTYMMNPIHFLSKQNSVSKNVKRKEKTKQKYSKAS